MSAYICGPMSGYPNFNFPAFDEAAAYLRSLLTVVFNPAEHDREVYPDIESWPGFATGDVSRCPKFSFADAMTWDLARVLEADEIVVLPGWQNSRGSRYEIAVAQAAGKRIVTYDPSGQRYKRLGQDSTPKVTVSAVEPAADLFAPVPPALASTGEVRITDPKTGGQKGQKLCQIGSLEPLALMAVGDVAGYGANKYAKFNFLKGYDWSLSYDALQRHLHLFWSGQDRDEESGHYHLAHAAWHCLAMLAFTIRNLGTDDRPKAKEE